MSMNNAHVAVCALLFVCFFGDGGGREEVVNQTIVEKKPQHPCRCGNVDYSFACVFACVHASAACCQRQPADFGVVSQLLPQIVKVERRTRPQRISKIPFIPFSIAAASPALRFRRHAAPNRRSLAQVVDAWRGNPQRPTATHDRAHLEVIQSCQSSSR